MRGPDRLRLLGAASSGLLLVLIFPGPDLGALAWVALIPLLLAIDGLPPNAAFRHGYLTGLIAFGGLLEWIRLFGLPAWVLLTAGMALFTGLFAAGVRVIAGSSRARALWVTPLVWMAVEVLRSVGTIGFPWGLLGLSQYRSPLMLTLASVVGVFGLSTLIALVNAAAASLVLARRVTAAAAAGAALAVLMLAVAVITPAPRGGPPRIVAAIQPNISPLRKGDPQAAPALVAGLLSQTEQAAAAGAEIIVYPETAVPADLEAAAEVRAALARRAGGATVVAGVFLPGPANGVVVLDRQGTVLGRYAKRRLVPFGEAGLVPGRDAAVVSTAAAVIGPIICYESAFPFLVRGLAADGAELIALLTNDGWFGTSAGPAQHAAHAVLRAAETGRSVVRAANTGSSMLIRPDGTVVASLPVGAEGVLVAALPLAGPATPFVRWGWLLGPLALAASLAAAVPAGLVSVRRQPDAARRLIVAMALPAVVWAAGALTAAGGLALGWPALLALFAAAAWTGRGDILDRSGLWRSAAASLVITGALVAAVRAGYAQYGFSVPLEAPAGGWAVGGLHLIAGGIAVEAWLRGAVFAPALRLGGWVLATALSTALGIALHLGAAQEVMLWHLLTGVAFSLVRLRTRDAVGLGMARGIGDAMIAALAGLR